MRSAPKLVVEIVIEREQILLKNQSEIASKFSPDAMTADELRRHHDSLVFVVRGFESETQPIFAIADVREFFQSLHKEWPYFLYFCHSGGQGLWDYSFCQLSTLSVLPKSLASKSQVNYSPAELFKLIGDSLNSLEKASERAGFKKDEIRARSRHILKYFKFLKSKGAR